MAMPATVPQLVGQVKSDVADTTRQIAQGATFANDRSTLDNVGYAEVLREFFRREAEKTSQRKLAVELGISRQAFNGILVGGKGRDIRPSHVDALARVRGVPLTTVLREVLVLAFEMETEAALPDIGTPLPGGGWGSDDLARRMGVTPRVPVAAGGGAPTPKRTGSTTR